MSLKECRHILLVTIFAGFLPSISFALTDPTITVAISPSCVDKNGVAFSGVGDATNPVILATGDGFLVCGGGAYKIEKRSASTTAKISVGNDLSNDSIWFQDTKITKIGASAQDLQITFQGATFGSAPADVPPGTIRYRISANGSFKRTKGATTITATGDQIRYNGHAKPTSASAWDPFSANSPQYTYTVGINNNIPANIVYKDYTPVTHPTSLKGEVWFKLADPDPINNTSDLVSLVSLIVQNDQGGADDCPTCTKRSDLSFKCMTTSYSSWKALGCPDCVTDDGLVAEASKVYLFTKTNSDVLFSDIAKGQGEYLASLANLLKVPAEQESQFYAFMQKQFAALKEDGRATPDALVAMLRRELTAAQDASIGMERR